MIALAKAAATGAYLLALHTTKPKTVMMSSWGYSHTNYRQETGSR